jgi:RNA recognition motif-containing protein
MFKDFYYAFVQFNRLDDARKAYEEFKYPQLCGIRCRILPYST